MSEQPTVDSVPLNVLVCSGRNCIIRNTEEDCNKSNVTIIQKDSFGHFSITCKACFQLWNYCHAKAKTYKNSRSFSRHLDACRVKKTAIMCSEVTVENYDHEQESIITEESVGDTNGSVSCDTNARSISSNNQGSVSEMFQDTKLSNRTKK